MDGTNESRFVAYDYKEVLAQGERAALLTDCYESLGWEVHEKGAERILFRRNRKIVNKTELTRLGRNLESCVGEIDTLQHSKTGKASITAISIGLIGTGFVAGSVFAVTASPPIIWLCVLLAIPGFLLWALAPILYPKMVARRSAAVNEMIEKKYDEIYGICEKGKQLLL